MIEARKQEPFLKWAGGKRWLSDSKKFRMPEPIGRYIEPFLGSGAMYFKLQPQTAILADTNADLITTYNAIKHKPNNVLSALKQHKKSHCKEYYYAIRSQKPIDPTDRAAWFIYLNRSCFNGLYRVNRNGDFNVPIGTRNRIIYDEDDFENISKILKNAQILNSDFEDVLNFSTEGDLIYIDPPYTVHHNKNGFLRYNQNIFSWNDQIRLRAAISRAKERGSIIIVSNANHSSIIELYADLGAIDVIDRKSCIAATPISRRPTSEIIIRINV